jgi:cell fate regulator YaaT (PSP1 superfamily)
LILEPFLFTFPVQGSLNTPPSSPEDDSSAGLIGGDIMKTRSSNAPAVAQTHCNASASISHCVTIEQATLPVHSVNNHKASGGGSVLIDSNSTGSSTPKIVYNVKFKRTQRSFILGPIAPREVKVGSYVKVEADRGEDLGIVISRVPAEKYCTNNSSTSRSGLRSSIGEPPTAGSSAVSCAAGDLKKVVRLATDEEISLLEDKRLEEDALLKICRLKVKQRGLNMNVVDAEYQFDRHKLIFFFEAEGRVDFRELVRDLFSIYKTRIWMQQLDKGGSGVNSVGICTAVGDDLEDDLFTGVDQQDVKSIAVSSPNE